MVVMVHFIIFCASDSDFADCGSIGSAGAVYGRGILVDGRCSSGAHGSDCVGCRVLLLVIVQDMVKLEVQL